MAASLPWYACLLATMIVAGALPVDASAALPGMSKPCPRTEDDQGMGGTQVRCTYSCPAAAELAIAVKSADSGAGVWGNTWCADAAATCNAPTPACAGASPGVTSYANEGVCEGESDEWWDSPLTVGCVAIGADAVSELCRRFPELCFRGSSSLAKLSPGPLEACRGKLSARQDTVLRDFVAEAPPGPIQSLVLYGHAPDPFVVTFDEVAGCAVHPA